MPSTAHPITYLRHLATKTLLTFFDVAKIMVPVMALVHVAQELGLARVLGNWLAPLMQWIGLPGEAGIVWAIALLSGIYGGLGALIALVQAGGEGGQAVTLTALQFNSLVSMILFAHAIPVEQAIVRRAGASFTLTTLARVFCALAFAALMHAVGNATGWLSEPASLGLLSVSEPTPGWIGWIVNTIKTMILMLVILFALLALVDWMKHVGLFDWLTRKMTPFFTALGIVPALAHLTTIGMMLGLTYGGGLILNETRNTKFSRKDLFAPLVGLSIFHAVFEDTVVMLAMGADFAVMLIWRPLFALVVLVAIAFLVRLLAAKKVAPTA
ncbi:MAG: nucleoside recognition domain-containing protein [Pseudomonadota bacterium]